MPDPTPEPIVKKEPVVVGDLADLLIYVGGTLGVLVPDDVAAKVVAAVVAVILWVQSTYLKRQAVTPEARSEARILAAYEDGVEAGRATAPQPPQAAVYQVGAPTLTEGIAHLRADLEHVDTDTDDPPPTRYERRVPRPVEPPDAGH